VSTLLLNPIGSLITMDEALGDRRDAAIVVRDHAIAWVGDASALPTEYAEVDQRLDLRDHVVLPGLVNTHHHMFQCLTRVMAQDGELFHWLTTLYPIWLNLRGEMVYTAAQTAMAELILSGCTTTSDHLYLYPNDVRLEDTIRAAQEIGIRFHPTRGSMSVGRSQGGLPPDALVEPDEAAILHDTRRLIETYHDAGRYAMLRIGVAPCSPFTVSIDLMRESAALARSYGVRLHTHLAENRSDIEYSLGQFHLRPGDYAESVGFLGGDVWHAHCVQLDEGEIDQFARTGTGVCHCPSSNMRLASGIAPIRRMLDRGVRVGLGVDGSASNDSGHLLNEARQAMLLQRVAGDPDPARLSAREALRLATIGGAQVLGRDDIGQIAPGLAADLIAFRLDDIGFAGAQHDPLAALVFCGSARVDLSIINGRIIVQDGHLLTIDLPRQVEQHNRIARMLLDTR
jgi:cytosine/adenosine deaminase-related metal-dependent hydrolase